MRALKLLSPFIVIIVVLVVGYFIYGFMQEQPAPDAGDLATFAEPQGFTDNPVDPANAFPPALKAFDFSHSHMEVAQEWWYFNTHMMDELNHRYSFMIAILKNGQVFGSLSILEKQRHLPLFTRTVVDVDPGNRRIVANWCNLYQPDPSKFEYEFTFEHDIANLYLKLSANKLPLPVGGEGYIAMGEAGKSYYYSLTNMSVQGVGKIGGKQVTLKGRGWMDRQWGEWLDRDFDQWHWYSIQLTNNVEIMLFDFRKNSKQLTPLCDVMFADGTHKTGLRFDIRVLGHWKSPKTGKVWSSGWQIDIPELNSSLAIIPDMQDQEVTDALWEGGCRVTGTYEGRNVWGRAFYEARHRTW